MMRRLAIVMLLCCSVFSFKSFASGISADNIMQLFSSLSEEDQTLYRTYLLEDIVKDFNAIAKNPETGQENSILQKRAAFEVLYRRLVLELTNKDAPPFSNYSELTQIRHSVEQVVLHAMSRDREAIFYGIADDVYDDVFADSDAPPYDFRQLTYTPLLKDVNGVALIVPMAAIATVLLARALPAGRGRILAVGATLTGLFVITGCAELGDFRQDHGESMLGYILQRYRLWASIAAQHMTYQYSLYQVMDFFHALVLEQSGIEVEMDETIRRQLYASVYATVVGFMPMYFFKSDFQSLENEAYLERSGVNGDDLNDELFDEDLIYGDTNTFHNALQIHVVWDQFVQNVSMYVTNGDLKAVLEQPSLDAKRKYLMFIHNVYKEFEITWNTIEGMVAHIKMLTESLRREFDPESMEDRRDWEAIKDYIGGLKAWTQSSNVTSMRNEEDATEGDAFPFGPENRIESYPLIILDEEERDHLNRLTPEQRQELLDTIPGPPERWRFPRLPNRW